MGPAELHDRAALADRSPQVAVQSSTLWWHRVLCERPEVYDDLCLILSGHYSVKHVTKLRKMEARRRAAMRREQAERLTR